MKHRVLAEKMDLPDELCLYFYSYLTCKDVVTMCRVSQRFNELSNDDGVWREQSLHQFGWLSNFGVSIEDFKASNGIVTKTWKATYQRFAKKYLSQVMWFSHSMNRTEAEQQLRGKLPGTYIVRNSSELPHYVVTYINESNGIEHALIHNLGTYKGVFFAGKTALFGTLSSLIQAHSLVLRKPALKAQSVTSKADKKRTYITNMLADPRARDGKTINELGLLHLACKYGLSDVVEAILNAHKAGKLEVSLTYAWSEKLRTPMHFLAERSGVIAPEVVQSIANTLVESELPCDFDAVDYQGNTPLHLTVDQYKPCDSLILDLVNNWNADVLASRKVDGCSVLHLAVQRNNLNLIAELAKKEHIDLDLNVKQSALPHRTPLHIACASGLLTCTKRLLQMGANPDVKDVRGSTPLHLCLGDPQDWTNLARSGKPMSQPNYSHQLVSVLLESRKVDINARDLDGRTPLHIACINGHRTSSLLLLENGCDIMIRDNSGMTAADYCRSGPTSWQVEQHVMLLEEKIGAGYVTPNFTPQSIREYAKKHYQQILDKIESMMKLLGSSSSAQTHSAYY